MITLPKTIDHFEYKMLTPEDIGEASQWLAKQYSTQEPMAIHLNIPEAELGPFFASVLEFIYKDSLSMIVIDTQSQHLVGVSLAWDSRFDWSKLQVSDSLLPIKSLMDECTQEGVGVNASSSKKVKTYVYSFLEIIPESEALLMAEQLVSLMQLRAVSLGYERAVNVNTRAPSDGHLQLDSKPYISMQFKAFDEFRYLGNKVFFNMNQKLPLYLQWDGNPTYSVSVRDIHYPLPEHPQESVISSFQSFLKEVKGKKHRLLGKPGNMAFDFSPLQDALSVFMNNSGDPFVPSSHGLSTKQFEQQVIHFFASAYGLAPESVFGYITNGGTEALEYGFLKGIKQYPNAHVILNESCHYSAVTIANKFQRSYSMLPCLDNGEVDYNALESELKKTDAPIVLIANIGSTMKGAIDDVQKIGSLLKGRPHYIHADAALHGSFLPFLPACFGAPALTIGGNIQSISISLHKFLGNITPAGLVLTENETNNSVTQENYIDVIASQNSTLTCSRSGLAAMLAAYRIETLGVEGLKEQALRCIELAHYLCHQLTVKGVDAALNKASNIVFFPAPEKSVCEKWMLPVTTGLSHAVVMPQADMSLLNEFIQDLMSVTVS